MLKFYNYDFGNGDLCFIQDIIFIPFLKINLINEHLFYKYFVRLSAG